MYAAERQQETLRLAEEHGRVNVPSLAARFHVTAETVRRDLKALARAGLLHRVHGGAVPGTRLAFEPDLAERDTVAADEKDRIAKAALAELPAEGSVILDAGSTTARLAQALPAEAAFTVVTHALPLAARLADHPGISLHLVGGRVRHRTRAAVDDWALRAYREINADVAVLATNGAAPQGALTTPDLAEAAVKRAIVAAAHRVVLVAHSAKFRVQHFARFADLSQVDTLVTDTGLDAGTVRAVECHGVRVVRA